MATVTLHAESDYGHSGQYIAQLMGREPKVQFRRQFVGTKFGKRNECTSYETDEVGVYEINNETRKGKVRNYYLVVEFNGEFKQLLTDKEDALTICKRLDSGELFGTIVKVELGEKSMDREGNPQMKEDGTPWRKIVYSIIHPTEAKRAVAAANIDAAVAAILALVADLPIVDQKKALKMARDRMGEKYETSTT